MAAAKFSPRPWPTAVALIGVVILIGLGSWQLHRRAWKMDLLTTIAAGMEAAPVTLPAQIDDPAAWMFRSVRIEGRFDNAHAFWLYGRVYEGKDATLAGVHLLVPLIREGAPGVLVDRGFVPFDHGSLLAKFATIDGPTVVEGVGRIPEPPGLFTPSTDPAANVWYSVDIPAMSRLSGLALAPVYIAAHPSDAAGWPAGTGGTEALGIRNEHLNYAIFWYSMAAVLAVIYVLSSRSRRS